MTSRSVVAMMERSASAAMAFSLPLGSMPFGRFLRFDFLAEFFFGVFGFAASAFVIGFFGRDRFVFGFFAFVGFFFASAFFGFVLQDQAGRQGRATDPGRMGRGGGGEQQQREEQQHEEEGQLAHRLL